MTPSARRRTALLAPLVTVIVVVIAMWIVACAARSTTADGIPDGINGSGMATDLLGSQHGFDISGSATTALVPGGSSPIDVRIVNTHDSALSVSRLDVTVDSISAPRSTHSLPCATSDFSIAQIDRPIEVEPGASISLSQLGWPESQWPQLSMLNTTLNQDGCVGADLRLVVNGVGELTR